MKNRYGIIAILGIISMIILITMWSSCKCRKKHSVEGLENAEESTDDQEEKEKNTKMTYNNNIPEGMDSMSTTTKPKPKTNPIKNIKESFDNMSRNFNNILFDSPTSNNSIPDFFKDILFSTECCPTSFSNSQGCACVSPSQYNILKNRGGNNVPYSEF